VILSLHSSSIHRIFQECLDIPWYLLCTCSSANGIGTVTSVGLSAPTGLTVSGSPVTTSGTLALSLQTGYNIPLTASTTNWNTTYNTVTANATNWNTAYTNRITSATAPLSIASNVLSLSQANTTTNGYLSSTDFNTFNAKQTSALAKGNFLVGSDAGVAQATSSVFISSTGNVGIGTNAPSYELDVKGSSPSISSHLLSPDIHASFTAMGGGAAWPRATFKIGSSAGNGIANVGFWVLPDVTGATQKPAFIEVLTSGDTSSTATKRLMIYQDINLAKIMSSSANGGGVGTDLKIYTQGATNPQLYLQSSTGYVGVGTSAPGVQLDVLGTQVSGIGIVRFKGNAQYSFVTLDTTTGGATDQSGFLLKTGGVSVGEFGVRASDNAFYFKNRIYGTSDIVTIASDGNVGIGTTTPTQNLTVSGTAGDVALFTSSQTWGTRISIDSTYTGGRNYGILSTAGGAGEGAGKFIIQDQSASNAARLVIDSTGNVGIGTTSPNTKLQVYGGIRVLGGNTFNGNMGYSFYGGSGDTDGGMFSPADGTLTFATNNVERVRITPAGYMGINTTAPAGPLQVVVPAFTSQDTNSQQMIISNSNSGAYGIRMGFTGTGGYGVINVLNPTVVWGDLVLQNGGGNVGIGNSAPATKLQVNGDIRTGTSGSNGCVENYAGTALAGTCSSDARLKTITGNITGILGKLSSLNLVNYYWNNTAASVYHNATTTLNTGFVAQDVQKLFPGLVTTDTKGYKRLDYTTLGLYGLEATKELNSGFTLHNLAYGATSTVASWYTGTTTPAISVGVTGNVGINTTSPYAKLSINAQNGETNTTLFAISSSTASVTNTLLRVSNTGVATFSGPGGVCVINGSGACTSDARLKTNIAPISGIEALDKLSRIQGITYTWRDQSWNQSKRVGVLAQNVLSAFPELVGSTTLDFNGVRGTYYTVNYAGLTAPLISAVNTLHLNLATIASTTASSTPESQSFSSSFFNSIFSHITIWFANSKNGVTDFFANRVRTKELCLTDGSGETCITRAKLDALLAGTASKVSSPTKVATSTSPLTITLHGANPTHVSVGSTYSELGAAVTGGKDGTDPYHIYVNGSAVATSSPWLITSSPTTYILTYTTRDSAGNTASTHRSVMVGNPDGTVSIPVSTTTTTPVTSSSTEPIATTTTATSTPISDIPQPETASTTATSSASTSNTVATVATSTATTTTSP